MRQRPPQRRKALLTGIKTKAMDVKQHSSHLHCYGILIQVQFKSRPSDSQWSVSNSEGEEDIVNFKTNV